MPFLFLIHSFSVRSRPQGSNELFTAFLYFLRWLTPQLTFFQVFAPFNYLNIRFIYTFTFPRAMAASLGLVGSLVPRILCGQGYLVGIALNQGEWMKGKEQVTRNGKGTDKPEDSSARFWLNQLSDYWEREPLHVIHEYAHKWEQIFDVDCCAGRALAEESVAHRCLELQ